MSATYKDRVNSLIQQIADVETERQRLDSELARFRERLDNLRAATEREHRRYLAAERKHRAGTIPADRLRAQALRTIAAAETHDRNLPAYERMQVAYFATFDRSSRLTDSLHRLYRGDTTEQG